MLTIDYQRLTAWNRPLRLREAEGIRIVGQPEVTAAAFRREVSQ